MVPQVAPQTSHLHISVVFSGASETPLWCIALSIPIRNPRCLRSFGDLASTNHPPKPLLTVQFRQQTDNEKCGSFFGQNNSFVVFSVYSFVVAQDAQEEIGGYTDNDVKQQR